MSGVNSKAAAKPKGPLPVGLVRIVGLVTPVPKSVAWLPTTSSATSSTEAAPQGSPLAGFTCVQAPPPPPPPPPVGLKFVKPSFATSSAEAPKPPPPPPGPPPAGLQFAKPPPLPKDPPRSTNKHSGGKRLLADDETTYAASSLSAVAWSDVSSVFANTDGVVWPNVSCEQCGSVHKWTKMRSQRVVVYRGETIEDPDDIINWLYTCVKCLAAELNITEREAQTIILAQRSTPTYARERNNKYKEVLAEKQMEFEGMSRSGLRKVTRDDLSQILEPLGSFISRKLDQLTRRSVGIEEHDTLLEEFKCCKDKARSYDLLLKIEALQEQLEADTTSLAFADKGTEQNAYLQVATFSDEWVSCEKGFLRAWYGCFHTKKNTVPKCGTVMASKRWGRKFKDPAAPKQKYYCCICGCRFNTCFGMLVQIMCKGVSTFALAPVSNHDVEDIRAMALEFKHKPTSTKEFYMNLPEVVPTDFETILRPARNSELHYSTGAEEDLPYIFRFVDLPAMEKVPKFNWDQILTFFH